MHKNTKCIFKAVLLPVFVWSVSIPSSKGQITVDSLQRNISKLKSTGNLTTFNESLKQLNSMFYSDTLLLMTKRAVAGSKEKYGSDHTNYAMSLGSLAILYMQRGVYEKALPLFQQATSIFKKAGQEENIYYTAVLKSLGSLYERMGQYDKASAIYQQTLEIRKKIFKENDPNYPLFYPLSLGDLAILYTKTGQPEKAFPLFQEALEIRRKLLGEHHPYYAISLNNLAWFYWSTGDYHKARPLFEQALDTLKKTYNEEDVDYLTALSNLISLYEETGMHEKARPLLEKSLAIRKKVLGEDHPDYAKSLIYSALLSFFSGNYAASSALFIEADNIILRHLSRTYSTLSEFEKWAFLNQELYQFYYLPSLLLKNRLAQPEVVSQIYANELTLKGMVLEDQLQVLKSARQSSDSISLNLYKQWRLNKALAGKQLLLPKTQRVYFLDSLEEATNQIEQALSRRSEAFRNLQKIQAVTGKDISNKLVKGQAAVEFLRFKLYDRKWTDSIMYAALVILPGDSVPRFVPLCEERKLLQVLKPSSNFISTIFRLYPPQKIRNSKPGDSLYQLIWKPLEKYLKVVHTVYYAPAGLLHRIAFKALRPDVSHLLVDKYQLNQVLSTRSVIQPAPLPVPSLTAGIWGNIDYNLQTESRLKVSGTQELDTTSSSFNLYTWDTRGSRGGAWDALPGTEKEIEKIGYIFRQAGIHTQISKGATATEEGFKALDGKSPQILHIATHGFFLPVEEYTAGAGLNVDNNAFTLQQNPLLRSGLVLAGGNHAWKGESALPNQEDGILTAYEIAQMDLSNINLAVLSACETALGDVQGNEGVIGLQRALKMAGVKQMILSLWRVPDKETMELMTLFYRNWIRGQPANKALQSAQLVMRKKYSPFYWAAFVLVE